jgi:6-phosphogluconolactonase
MRMTAAMEWSMLAACIGVACNRVGGEPRESAMATREGIVVYAGEGKSLATFHFDSETGKLVKVASVDVAQPVQYGAIAADARHLYVSLSDNARSHFIGVFAIDPITGALAERGAPAVLPKARAIHIELDRSGKHLLMAHNVTHAVDAQNVSADGTLGDFVAQPGSTETGNFAHQVRADPSGRFVLTCARGTDAGPSGPEQTGQITVWSYQNGALQSREVVTPGPGVGPRHLDFKGEHNVYVAAERGNLLLSYRFDNGSLTPLFRTPTVPDGGPPGQRAGAIHVHTNGSWLYVSNRDTATVDRSVDGGSVPIYGGGLNEIALFRLDAANGEPRRIAGFDSHGFEPRTFTIDPTGRFVIVANQKGGYALHNDDVVRVHPNLAVFRIGEDGALTFVQSYELEAESLWVDSVRLGGSGTP